MSAEIIRVLKELGDLFSATNTANNPHVTFKT